MKDLVKKYNVEYEKGVFSYTFTQADNLKYIRFKPDYKYYCYDFLPNKENIRIIGILRMSVISIKDYNNIPNNVSLI